MSKLDDIIKQFHINPLINLSLFPGAQERYKAYQEAEEVVIQIAMLKPNTLEITKFYQVCMDVCTNYPDRTIDTLRALRWHLASNLDTPLRRNFEEKLRKAEHETPA